MSDEYHVRLARCGGSPTVYHSDDDCRCIGDHYRTVDEEHVTRRGLRECRFCSGAATLAGGGQYRPLRTRIEQGEIDT